MRKVIDQGWVWGGVGDVNVGSVLAWGREPERDHGQISAELCNNEAWQGLCEGGCLDQYQQSRGWAQDQSGLVDS